MFRVAPCPSFWEPDLTTALATGLSPDFRHQGSSSGPCKGQFLVPGDCFLDQALREQRTELCPLFTLTCWKQQDRYTYIWQNWNQSGNFEFIGKRRAVATPKLIPF